MNQFTKYINAFFKSWQNQATAQAATLSVLVGTYTIVVVTMLLHQNLETILSKWGSEVKLSVYLKDEIPGPATTAVKDKMDQLGLFDSIRYISKETALVDFQKRMGSLAPSLVQDKSFENPLPASFEAVLSPQKTRQAIGQLPKAAEMLMKMMGVEDVSYGQGWIENYAAVIKVFRVSSIALIFILAMGCLLVIGNSIKSSVMARRDEIEVLELFGATSMMIVAPFLIEGAIMGLLGAGGALFVSGLIYSWQSSVLIESLGFWGFADTLTFLTVGKCLMVIAVGTALGALGSFLCVRQINTGWVAADK